MGVKRYIAAAALSFAAASVIYFPASWAAKISLPQTPMQFGGTVWNGHIRGLGGLPPIAFTLSPTAIISSKDLMAFNGSGGGITLQGTGSSRLLKTISITGDASFLSQIDARMAGLSGEFSLGAAAIGLDGSCSAETQGRLSTDILAKNGGAVGWSGPQLSGPITCDNGVISATLSGASTGQTIEANLKMLMNGSYQIRAAVSSTDPRAGLVLPLYGFEQRGERFTMTEAGSWR